MGKVSFEVPEMSPAAQAAFDRVVASINEACKQFIGAPVDCVATQETVRAACVRLLDREKVEVLGGGITHVFAHPSVAERVPTLWGLPVLGTKEAMLNQIILDSYVGVDVDRDQCDATKLVMIARFKQHAILHVEWQEDLSALVVDGLMRDGSVLSDGKEDDHG
ncbi:MAG: hypothetical protein WC683_01065 [bacterium]